MWRLSALALVVLFAAPAPAGALSRRLLVIGDSLAVGTRPYVPPALDDWRVRQATAVSMHAHDGAALVRSRGRRLPRVIHISLGTNDDPNLVASFRAAVEDVMEVAGDGRCVVWANIVRPPYEGTSYTGYNRALRAVSRERDNLRILDWVRMVDRHPGWLAQDGVHVSAAGYKARARAVARQVGRCVS